MTVEDLASSKTDVYVYEVEAGGVRPRPTGLSNSTNNDNGESHGNLSSQTYGSKYSTIMEDENGVIRSLEELGLDETNQISEEDGDGLQKAPDGGYGWVICCGVFINQMICGGIARSEGLFFLQFQSRFDASAQLAAWPGSLMATLNLFMGPLCGAVVSRYSVRSAFVIGTSFVFLGMFLNGFAPNIYFLFLSHTLIRGLGRGLMSGLLLLNLYFDKNRSMATGLASSGIGVGSLWVVPLTQYLFDEYGFMGAFMILSAVCLHSFLVAMMFRPLSMHYRFIKSKLRKSNEKPGITDESKAMTADSNGNIEKHQVNNVSNKIDSEVEKLSTISDKFIIDSNSEMLSGDAISKQQELILEETRKGSVTDSRLSSLSVTTQPSSESALALQEGRKRLLGSSLVEKKLQPEPSDYCCKSSLEICFPVEFKRKGAGKKKAAFDWTLLKNLPFIVYCLANFLFILAFRTAFTFLPAITVSKGLSKQEAALILTISGALDTFGRLAFGFIMNLKPLRPFRPYAFNVLLFIIAAASLVIPSLTTFASFSIVCSVYGFMTGAYVAQKTVVLVDILGREKMPSSFGIQKVFQGFGTLIGPPFAGALRDALGTYDSSFYLGGASMIGAGLLLFLSTILLNIRNRKAKLANKV